MKWKQHKPTGLIGLCRTAGSLHLAAVKSHGDKIEVVSSASGDGDAASLIARLDADVRDWPVVVALPPQAGLHRSLDLPTADNAATQKMVALRIESLFPLEDTELRWGWQRKDNDTAAWVYLASAAAVNQHTPALPPANPSAGAVSQEMALTAQLLERDPHASLILVTSTDEHAAVTVVIDGKLHGVEQADLDGDDAAQLTALDEALAAFTDAPRPSRLLVTGSASSLAAALADRWQVQRTTVSQLFSASGEGLAIATGAATALLHDNVPVIAFAHDAKMPAEDRRRLRRRVFQAGGWLGAALIAMAVVDLRNASMLENEQIDTVMSADERTELSRQRALGMYVQSLGPTPLAILDEIGQRTKNIQLDDITYDATGDFRLRGKLGSTETVNELVNALSKMQTLDKVSLVSQKSGGRDQVEFEITAKPNKKFFAGFATVPKDKPDPDNRQASRSGPTASVSVEGEATP